MPCSTPSSQSQTQVLQQHTGAAGLIALIHTLQNKPPGPRKPGHNPLEARCALVSATGGLAPVWTPTPFCTSISLISM